MDLREIIRSQDQRITTLQHELSVSNGLLEELVAKEVQYEQEAQQSADYFRQHGIFISDPQVRAAIVRVNRTLETWKGACKGEERSEVLKTAKEQEEEVDVLLARLKTAIAKREEGKSPSRRKRF